MTRDEYAKRPGRSSKWIRPEKRKRIYARDGGRCLWCGSAESLTLDHFLPKALGGGNEAGNLVTCCYSCNSRRQHKPALAYASDIGDFEALDRCIDALARPLPLSA